MEGNTLRQRQAPQVIRCFAPTRLADDLLAVIYERLLAAGTPHSGGRVWSENGCCGSFCSATIKQLRQEVGHE
jgi:hypothetical protein